MKSVLGSPQRSPPPPGGPRKKMFVFLTKGSFFFISVRHAQLVGPQAYHVNAYVALKLQNVKSTTVPLRGPQPCWEQDFLL